MKQKSLDKYITFSKEYIKDDVKTKDIYFRNEDIHYSIDTNGQIINTQTQKKLKMNRNNEIYSQLVIHSDIYGNHHLSVHRLVALAFIKNENPAIYNEVNHKDYNKSNNNVDNLEWCTPQENMIHAARNENRKSANSFLTSDVVNSICKLLEENEMSVGQISKKTCVSKLIIYKILQHKAWIDISKNYNLDNYTPKTVSKYTENQIIIVCELLQKNEKTISEISDISNVSIKTIWHIVNKLGYCSISDKYNICNYDVKDYKCVYDDESIKQVCIYLQENKLTMREISEKTGVPMNYVNDIRIHKKRTKISDKYDIDNYSTYIHREEYSSILLEKIDELIISGNSNKEIRNILNLPHIPRIKSLLQNHRKSLRKKYNKNNIVSEF